MSFFSSKSNESTISTPPTTTSTSPSSSWQLPLPTQLSKAPEKLISVVSDASGKFTSAVTRFIPTGSDFHHPSSLPSSIPLSELRSTDEIEIDEDSNDQEDEYDEKENGDDEEDEEEEDEDPDYVDETLPDLPIEDSQHHRIPSPICCSPTWWSVPGGEFHHPRWRRVFFRWRTLIILIIVAALGTLGYLFFKSNSPIRSQLFSFFSFLEQDVPVFWGSVVFAEVYALAEAFFLPGTPFDLAAGFAFGAIVGGLSAWIGATVGSIIAFWYGRTLLRKWASAKMNSSPKLKALDRAIGDNSFKLVLLTRLSPVLPNPLLSYVYGVTRVKFIPYLCASFLGFGPMTILYAYFGSVLRDVTQIFHPDSKTQEQQKSQKIITLAVSVVTTIIIMVVITVITRRALAKAMDTPAAETAGATTDTVLSTTVKRKKRRTKKKGEKEGGEREEISRRRELSLEEREDGGEGEREEMGNNNRRFSFSSFASRSSNSSTSSLLSNHRTGYEFETNNDEEQRREGDEGEEEVWERNRKSGLRNWWDSLVGRGKDPRDNSLDL